MSDSIFRKIFNFGKYSVFLDAIDPLKRITKMQTFAATPPLVRTIVGAPAGSAVRKLPDGSSMILNDNGRVVQVEYSSGSIVSRHDEFCFVQTAAGDYWYCDKQSNWHCLD